MSERLARRGVQLVVVLISFLIGAGLAVAAIPGLDGRINACVDQKSGDLRVIDAEAGEVCAKGEDPLDWNQRGPDATVSDGFTTLTNATYTVVTDVDLPPGTYMIVGKALLQNTTSSDDLVACNLTSGGANLDTADVTLAAPSTVSSYATIPFAATHTLAAAGKVQVECITIATSPGPGGNVNASGRLVVTTLASTAAQP